MNRYRLAALVAVAPLAATAAPPAATEACREIGALLADTPRATVTRRDGDFADPRFSGRRHVGCIVSVQGTGHATNPAFRLYELEQRGWRQQLEYAADGPDGTQYALYRPGEHTLCIVQGEWQGHDDSDPAYKPPEEYRVSISCAHDPTLANYRSPPEEAEGQPRIARPAEPLPGGARQPARRPP